MTTTNHPADHPVFANMPNTQAALRREIPTPALDVTTKRHDSFTCTTVEAPSISVSRFHENSHGPHTAIALHGVTDLVSETNPETGIITMSMLVRGEVVRIDLFPASLDLLR
jgi:hypothetical protein